MRATLAARNIASHNAKLRSDPEANPAKYQPSSTFLVYNSIVPQRRSYMTTVQPIPWSYTFKTPPLQAGCPPFSHAPMAELKLTTVRLTSCTQRSPTDLFGRHLNKDSEAEEDLLRLHRRSFRGRGCLKTT